MATKGRKHARDLFFCEAGFDLLEGAPGENQFVRAQDVVGVERFARDESHIWHIPRGERQVFVGRVGDEQRRALEVQGGQKTDKIQRGEHTHKLPGFGGIKLEIVHKDHVAGTEALGQGFAQGKLSGAVRDLFREIAGFGSEDDATAAPLG